MTDLAVSARVGANVRRYRQGRRMPLRRLSEMLHDAGLDLSISGLSRLEHGDRPVSVDELVTLADVLDQAPADLLEQETVITGGGDLRMRLDRHDVEPEPPAEPAPTVPALVDPAILRAIADLQLGAEMRATLAALASSTVTQSNTLDTLQAISRATVEDVGRRLADQVGAVARATAMAAVDRRGHRPGGGGGPSGT